MSFCVNCGAEIKEYEKFCSGCGYPAIKLAKLLDKKPSMQISNIV